MDKRWYLNHVLHPQAWIRVGINTYPDPWDPIQYPINVFFCEIVFSRIAA